MKSKTEWDWIILLLIISIGMVLSFNLGYDSREEIEREKTPRTERYLSTCDIYEVCGYHNMTITCFDLNGCPPVYSCKIEYRECEQIR